jgi:predicted DNA-binding protein
VSNKFKVVLSPELRAGLKSLAKSNGRTSSGEVRWLIALALRERTESLDVGARVVRVAAARPRAVPVFYAAPLAHGSHVKRLRRC